MNQSLVKNQHTLPAKYIQRFVNLKKVVQVILKGNDKPFTAKANNRIFCLERVWDT